jgi:hypothetical protein
MTINRRAASVPRADFFIPSQLQSARGLLRGYQTLEICARSVDERLRRHRRMG